MKFARNIPVWVIIFTVAYLLRFIYIIEIADRPYFTAPAVDAEYHDQWAQDIAGGKLLQEEPFFRAPLYPFFLGGIYALLGHDYFAARIIQILIGSFTCVLVYILGRELFSPRVGKISGFLAACTGIIIYFEGELLLPVILLPLYLTFFLLMFRARRLDGIFWWGLTGFLLGLSAITRPNILAVIPVLLFIIFSHEEFRKGLKRLFIVIVGFLLPLAPVTCHNILAGEFVPIATQGGVNFYIGNNSQSTGLESVFPGLGNAWLYEEAVLLAEQEVGRELSANKVSNYYYGKGVHFIVNQLLPWVKLTLKKALFFLGRVEISNNRNIYFSLPDSLLLTVLMNIGFWIFGPLGILGMVLTYKRSVESRILIWCIVLYSLSIIIFFVTSRYRLPLFPIFIIFSVTAVELLVEQFRNGNFRALGKLLAVLIPLFLLVNINFLGTRKISEPYGLLSLGNAYMKNSQLDEAEEQYRKIFVKYPAYPQGHLNLGVVLYKKGLYDQAEEEFLKEIQVNRGREVTSAYNNLGNVRLMQGRPDDAVYFYRKALERRPGFTECRMNLVEVLSELGLRKIAEDSLDKAQEYYESALELSGDSPTLKYNYGLVLGEMGDEEGALKQMREVLRIAPDFSPALKVLEAYEKMQGNSPE